jgi:hypothetical protein
VWVILVASSMGRSGSLVGRRRLPRPNRNGARAVELIAMEVVLLAPCLNAGTMCWMKAPLGLRAGSLFKPRLQYGVSFFVYTMIT